MCTRTSPLEPKMRTVPLHVRLARETGAGITGGWVAAGGAILVILGLLPVLGRIMNAIPQPVLGGAGIVLFGSVAAAGIRTLSRVNFTNSNVLIVAVSIGVGIIPITVPEVYNHIPEWLATIFESGISATAIFACC